jgi:type IV pilus assembly protein PilM
MASGNAVWGIDIGQCALKALRCTVDEDGNVVADAFDFIEYPKILSQPEAVPDELIREALETFLSRNEIKGDMIAMSVSGQAGLSRFFKPPPVDAKVLPDIVKYEAKQQIPFALEDVIWDYQQLGGVEVDGFTLDAEVGLFAMKREQVFRSIKPFTDADVEVDIVQLAPLCIYNFVTYDVMTDLPSPEEIDPENPPESVVILSMGTETTDLVITNGSKLWQRSIPLGGNHFTKQLTKEMKLTFAKAEHLKRNAREAEDPKKIFQAMRPIFNDLVTEVQRSITYFQSIDRQAKIGKVVMLGNAVKLPGLRQYLEKNLGNTIVRVQEFKRLSGASVVTSPAFKENVLSFGVCYGLCLQALDEAKLATNLLPREFFIQRLIRAKKPWAAAAVAAVLLALTINFGFYILSLSEVRNDRADTVYVNQEGQPVSSDTPGARTQEVSWKKLADDVTSLKSQSDKFVDIDTKQKALLNHVAGVGEEVVGNADRKLLWLELMRAINEAMPVDPRIPDNKPPDPEVVPFVDRENLQVDYIETEYFPDLKAWFAGDVPKRYAEELQAAGIVPKAETPGGTTGAPAVTPAPAPTGAVQGTQGVPAIKGPEGPGYVIEIKGYHFHNSDKSVQSGNFGAIYVRNTLIKSLRDGKIRLPADPTDSDNPGLTEFTFEEMGIGFPLVVEDSTIDPDYTIANPKAAPVVTTPGNFGAGDFPEDEPFAPLPMPRQAAPAVDPAIPPTFPAPRYDFRIQFCWQERRLSERLQERAEAAALEAARRAEAERQRAAAEAGAEGTSNDGTPAPVEPAPAPMPAAPAAAPGVDAAAAPGEEG